MPGMLLHIDGTKHCWFQNGQGYDLVGILDDAANEIYYARLGKRGILADSDGRVARGHRDACCFVPGLRPKS